MALAAPSRDLTAARELVEELVGRPLRRAEQAIDVLRLDQALQIGKDELEEAIRAEMTRAAWEWISGRGLGVKMIVSPAMTDALDALTETGREEALLEMERLGYENLTDPVEGSRLFAVEEGPRADRDTEAYLARNLPSIEVRIVDELVAIDLSSAAQTAVAQALLNVPGARDVASRVVSTALIDGLALTFEQNSDLVRCWEYTALMDPGTCSACSPLDGRRYDTLQALFRDLPNFGPNPRCKGGGRCRCRAVPCPVDEVGQNDR